MGGLGFLPWQFFGRAATGVSGDGSVVVGVAEPYEGYEAFRWTSEGGVWIDGDPFGGPSYANGVSADGSVTVGWSASPSGREAFRWTNDDGMVGLGMLPGHVSSEARGVSGDGSVVVGISYSDDDGESFRWTSGGGMEPLWDVLVAHGVDPAADGWTGLNPLGISADGRTIVGSGTRNGNTEAFAAFIHLPGDFNFDGSVDAADYVVWRENPGGTYTSDDYTAWRTNFGEPTSGGAAMGAASDIAVPEPGSLALLTLAVPALLRRRRTRRYYVPPVSPSPRRALNS
jgi:probable HAF family extracellular repeat protein